MLLLSSSNVDLKIDIENLKFMEKKLKIINYKGSKQGKKKL